MDASPQIDMHPNEKIGRASRTSEPRRLSWLVKLYLQSKDFSRVRNAHR